MSTRVKIEHDQLKGELTAIDRVSELPWGILDNILGRLQMREAVRTSILSRQWRYKWVNLSKLLFDVVSNRAVWNFPKPRCVEYHIFNVLLSHCGNIHTFKLCNTFPEKFSNLQTWICYLARNGIRAFTLEYACAAIDFANLFKLPACIWSCEHLTHLQLRQYELPQPPCASKGRFRNLVSLNLYGKLNDIQLLENLICNCPVLQILMLNGLQNLACLSIQAPKLKQVDLQGKLGALVLKSCSVLAEITLVITSDEFTSIEYQDEGRIHHLEDIQMIRTKNPQVDDDKLASTGKKGHKCDDILKDGNLDGEDDHNDERLDAEEMFYNELDCENPNDTFHLEDDDY
ncbi:F-box/FBD/LRR-repeat protein At1g13570-like [Mangifera indica]|uniref:F-box/FBD/LRR-repeat protein At1g13570-like n=1 Tax=Mangifera indica TaxID=29780 RepID=UPI001CFAD206|nr:F-box/FBD/LRR-repeat protein At1g13570-like [Mangifera indica]